jgi:coenzyme F420-reducing hydrogenase gamma subunit
VSPPGIAIAGLTACSGCQLTLLNCEAEMGDILAAVELRYFPMADDPPPAVPPLAAALVEGAVSTERDLATLRALRQAAPILIALGTCAVWGGVATLRNDTERGDLARSVYGDRTPGGLLLPTPLHRHVPVDFAIVGCPPEKGELLRTLAALARGTLPLLPDYPVCMECRARGLRCLLQEDRTLCLGPLSRAGCNARCPATAVGCEGCRGPADEASVSQGRAMLATYGFTPAVVAGRLRRFVPPEEWPHAETP